MRWLLAAGLLATLPLAAAGSGTAVGDRVQQLTRASQWTRVAAIPLDFRSYHPQGLVRIDDTFYLSSVEVTIPTRRLPAPSGGFDRDAGQGAGHLFKFDAAGRLLADLKIGEGAIYHPGGIDFDGRDLWVPVAEYRPDSRSIVYRVEPQAMRATEVFRFSDHIGAIVHNTDDRTLHGVSWGSRRFYRWAIGRDRAVTKSDATPDALRTVNPSHYVDYQDCKYAGARRMLCTGVTEIRSSPEAAPFRLGGLDLVDLRDGRPLHQVPVLLWTPAGLDMTHNPVWIEPHGTGLRGYFVPEDNASTMYIYDVAGS